MESKAKLHQAFVEQFGEEPQILVHAPGRVNLIGEHTDYNEGFVFPAAINFGTWVAARPRVDKKINIFALDYEGQNNVFDLDNITFDENQGWANYVRGVTKVLLETYPTHQVLTQEQSPQH